MIASPVQLTDSCSARIIWNLPPTKREVRPMESRRYLRCLGQPALFAPTGELIRFRTRKHLALLVYLAVEPRRAHPRDRLAELLWPAGSRAEARHSLATALSTLRPRVGPGVLETDRDRVTLLPTSLALDLDRLTEGDILGSEVTGPLEVASFLDGFDIPESGEFGMWKDRQQARLLPPIKDALIILIDRSRRTGDSRQIEQLADRMLAVDELSEEAIRAKMEARAFAGDRLTALRIFEEWKKKVGEELGAAPSDLVEGMAVRLRRRGWERTALTHIPTVPTDQWKGRPFIGRAAEYRVLYEGWERMRKGAPGHALVLGDSGIGKTTLVSRVTTAAGLEGAAVSRVQCYDLEREIPYAAISGLICGLLDTSGASATPPEALAELARAVPEVRRRFPSIPPPSDSQGETARIRLTEAFHQMLLAICEEHPVILVVDDLHLADDASLSVLHLVMRRSRGQPIMVLLIARTGELSRSPHASGLREASEFEVREIDLPPMSEQECRDLLRSLVPTDRSHPSPSILRTLLQAASGLPMVLELLIQDWQSHGNESLALAIGAMTSEFHGSQGPSIAYRHILTHISAALDAQSRNVLNLAAVLGHRLNDLDMYDLLEVTPGQCVAGLSRLAEFRVLRDGSQGLEFSNELIRAHAYAAIPSPIRRTLHGMVSDRLLGLSTGPEGSSGLEIAWHCMRAGRTTDVLPHLLRGAREAVNRGAPHEAERALSSALPYLEGTGKIEGILLLAEVLQEQGCWQESLDCLNELGPRYRGERRDEAVLLSARARLHQSTSAAEAAFDRVEELTEIVRGSPVERTRVRAGVVLAGLLSRHRNERLSEELLAYVEAIPTRDLDADSIGELDLARAWLLFQAGQTARSFKMATQAVETMSSRKAANLVTVELRSGLAALRCRQGQYEEAVLQLGHALSVAELLSNDTAIRNILANLSLCLARLGRYDEQKELAPRVPQMRGAELTDFADVLLTYSLALGHAMRNQPQQALGAISYLETRLVGRIPKWMMQAWSLWKADILYICGKKAEAIREADSAIGASPTLYARSFAGPFARWLSILGSEQGSGWLESLVEDYFSKLESFDALDQAEILCARWRLQRHRGDSDTETLIRLRASLARLPLSVQPPLRALGMLPSQ